MTRFLIALVALLPLAVNAASISKFSSISVAATNFQSEVVVTNGLTLGGVRNTSWPAGGIAGTVSNNVASAGLLSVDSTKTNGIAATFAHVTNALGVAVSQAELGYVSGVTSAIQTQLNAKAPLASPALTGTPTINGASIETQLTNKVAKSGDTMTGALTVPNVVVTNAGISTIPIQVNALSGTTNTLVNVNTGGTNRFTIDAYGNVVQTVDDYGGSAWFNVPGVNSEYLNLYYAPGLSAWQLSTLKTGSGTARGIRIQPTTDLVLGAQGYNGATWTFANAGGFIPGLDNNSYYSLGSASKRFADGYFGGRILLGSADTILTSDAANTLALRNGANAQTFNIYNTYTDASNYERLQAWWVGNVASIRTIKAGTGSIRDLALGGNNILFQTGASASTTVWQINSSGHILAFNDNSYDIGASGANRPRSVFAGDTIRAGIELSVNTSAYARIKSTVNGVALMQDQNNNDFNRIQLGGTTSSFPSLKRNGTALESRLADDSNYAPLNAPWQQSGYIKVCTSAVSNALFYVSVPNTNMIGGRVLYTVSSTDGTDAQQITGTLQFGAVGKSTTVTANVTDVQNTSTVSAGTLTASLTANVSTNNVFALMVTPTTSLTTTNLTVRWRLETPSTYTVNPL